VAKRHSRRLRTQFPELLATSAIKTSFSTLVGNITLVSVEDIHRCGHVDLVVAGWPCQGMSMASKQNGLQDGCSSRFHDMIRVMGYLQTSQRRPPGYIVENVPVVSSSWSRTLESMHKIDNVLGMPVLIDAAAVGSRAHRPWLWWTNLAPAELLQSAVGRIKRPDVYVSDILDPHRAPRRVYHDDQAPLAVVNRKGELRRALPTLLALPVHMPLRIMDRGSCGTLQHRRWWSLTRMRGREPWAFPWVLLTSLASQSINDDSC
jgi:hypothetical protein